MATAPAQLVEDVWACCDTCDKWRRLPPGTILDEKEKWCGIASLLHCKLMAFCVAPWMACAHGALYIGRERERALRSDKRRAAKRQQQPIYNVVWHRYCRLSPDPLRNTCDAPEEVRAKPLRTRCLRPSWKLSDCTVSYTETGRH